MNSQRGGQARLVRVALVIAVVLAAVATAVLPSRTQRALPIADAARNEAAESARHLLAAALERGQLSPDDARLLRGLLARAAPAEAREIRRRMAAAINHGKLIPARGAVLP